MGKRFRTHHSPNSGDIHNIDALGSVTSEQKWPLDLFRQYIIERSSLFLLIHSSRVLLPHVLPPVTFKDNKHLAKDHMALRITEAKKITILTLPNKSIAGFPA
jgi:hypothetical protein